MSERRRTRRVAYSVAVLAPAISLLIRWPLQPVLGDAVPHMAFFPAVMVAAYLGGFWPGLLATLLSAAAAAYFLIEPRYSFAIANPAHAVALALFVLVGTMLSILSESLHQKVSRIAGLADDITERKRAEESLRESERRWRSLTEALPQLVWTAMPDG